MNEKQEINILDIIKAYQKKDFEYLRTIGELTCDNDILYVNDDINVFYQFKEKDLKKIFQYNYFEIDNKVGRINNIYNMSFLSKSVEFEFGDDKIDGTTIKFLATNEKDENIPCEFVITEGFAITYDGDISMDYITERGNEVFI